jgi:hypothetical protein
LGREERRHALKAYAENKARMHRSNMKLDKRKFFFYMVDAGYKNIAEIAVDSNIHRNTITDYLTGNKSVFSTTVLKLAETLKVHPLELTQNDDQVSLVKKVANVS